MRAEQAIYTSARTRMKRGYHLTSQSPGIDEAQARSLIRWCPSHAGLASNQPDASSLNFHPVTDSTVALSRTVYGGAEYSARGGLQIVTRILLLHDNALASYACDPVTLARVAMALGFLRLDPTAPDQLPPVDLPDRPVRNDNPFGDSATMDIVRQVLNFLGEGRRVAVIGANRPIPILAILYSRLRERQRLELSFTTGLKPSMNRAFRLHFLPSVDLTVQHQLASQGIAVLDLNSQN
jgi:hypothetical protein